LPEEFPLGVHEQDSRLMISVICVYNDSNLVQHCLLKSLSEQETGYETIILDNTQNRFKSAAEALNWGAAQAAGDYVMFVHQDVALCSNSFFAGLEALLDSLPNLGVAGIAGISECGGPFLERLDDKINHRPQQRFRNAITQGPQKDRWGTPITEPERVQTLDECLVIIPKKIWQIRQFDEAVCDGWHLYAADYCLSVAASGFGIYVIPKSVHHQSKGFTERGALGVIKGLGLHPEEYYLILRKVLKKHKGNYKWIHTSCGSWNTAYPLALQRVKLAFKHVILSVIFRG
jgi:Glycosyltransferase like family